MFKKYSKTNLEKNCEYLVGRKRMVGLVWTTLGHPLNAIFLAFLLTIILNHYTCLRYVSRYNFKTWSLTPMFAWYFVLWLYKDHVTHFLKLYFVSCPHNVPSWILRSCTSWGHATSRRFSLGYLETPRILCSNYASSPRAYRYSVQGYRWVTLLL